MGNGPNHALLRMFSVVRGERSEICVSSASWGILFASSLPFLRVEDPAEHQHHRSGLRNCRRREEEEGGRREEGGGRR
eukprot:1608533-Rhodomonas_salina.3